MKEDFDKEIDSLLRRRTGVGAQARAFGAGSSRDASHLDADELSAFAEGALPAAARGAAALHMADCDECRGLAVSLARASGAEAELERRAVVASVPASESVAARGRTSSWWSTLFAPRALKYAAPALALCLVAVVTFVALRARREDARLSQGEFRSESPQIEVAKNQSGDSTLSANANESLVSQGTGATESRNASAATSNSSPSNTSANDAASGSAASHVATEDKKAEEPSAPPPPPAKSEASGEAASPVMSKVGPPVEVADASRSDNNKEKSARQSQAEEVTVVNDSPAQQQGRAANNQSRGMEVQMPDGARGQKRGTVENAPSSSGGSLASAAPKSDRDRSATNSVASRRARPSDEQRERSGEDEAARTQDARSVAGHRFRREGGAWVDVNYRSNMASTGVRRGTDAYRALVADISEIGRIAQQLSGEVVVVVNGRAYRIR